LLQQVLENKLRSVVQPVYSSAATTETNARPELAVSNAQNPLRTFPRDFPVDEKADNLLWTCYGETGVMDFGVNSAFGVNCDNLVRN